MDSILISIKKMLNVSSLDDSFDPDIIIYTNTALGILEQEGICDEPFVITGPTETWSDFIGNDARLEMVKSWVALKVRSLFDPPQNGAVREALDKNMAELEWRIYTHSNFTKG